MTESPEHQGTKSSVKKRIPRSVYLRQQRSITHSKLLIYLAGVPLLLLTPMAEVRSAKQKLSFKCGCGATFSARTSDMLRTEQRACNSCSRRSVMLRSLATPTGQAHHQKMVANAAKANTKDPVYVALRRRCNVAKDRCVNPRNQRFEYYGGRGVEFRFASPVQMAEWILEHLGPPALGQSIDREDNNGHYEPGNLRWATPTQQGQNKRDYSQGGRVRALRKARPDYHENTIRALVKAGLTDEEIINRRKWNGCGAYIRHS